MEVTIVDEGTTIDMSFYVGQVLEDEDGQEAGSPMMKEMYNVDDSLQKLTEVERQWFQSNTAKLLYLAKLARQDILTAVIFL
jgi:hypothetical protein